MGPHPRSGVDLVSVIIAVLLLVGCVTSATRPTEPPPTHVAIHVATFPWQTQLAWIVTLHDNSSSPYDDVRVMFSVEKRGGIPAGDGQDEASISPEKDAQLRFTTANLGYGDYFYNVTATGHGGEELGEAHGMFEMCAC